MSRGSRKPFVKSLGIDLDKVLKFFRPYLAGAIIPLCLMGVWGAGSAGLSRLYSNSSRKTGSLELSDRAVRLSAADPDAHSTRGFVLAGKGESVEAIGEIESAAALRPRDYYLWKELGEAREHSGDKEGALAAYGESAKLAPFYATPRWYLGNTYLRAGQRDEAFVELRRAYTSDPTLLPAVIDLAWRAYEANVDAVREAIRPDDSVTRLALELFFFEHDHVADAVKLFLDANPHSDWEQYELLNRLLASKRFAEGYEVWAKGRVGSQVGTNGIAKITDGDFEGRIALDEPGFGWQFQHNIPNVSSLLDPVEAHAGSQSLRLEYRGDSDPTVSVLSELVLTESETHYRLSFAARTKDLVAGGAPIVAVIDASDEKLLAQSTGLPRGTNGWQVYSVDFGTPEKTSAVVIQIRRQSCDDAPCPAFGFVWFDSFVMQKS